MSDDARYRRFNLRIPKEVYERVQKDAAQRSHSINAEILRRLDVGFSVEEDDIGKLSEWALSVHKQENKSLEKNVDKLIKSLEKATEVLRKLNFE